MRQHAVRWIVATVAVGAVLAGCAPEPLPPLEPLPVRPVDVDAQRQVLPPDPTEPAVPPPTTAPSQPAPAEAAPQTPGLAGSA